MSDARRFSRRCFRFWKDATPCRGRAGDRTKVRSHFVTFVGTGAFIGLNVEPGPVQAGALIAEGFIPEFIAVVDAHPHGGCRSRNARQNHSRPELGGARMSHLFGMHGISLVVDEKAIDSLVDQALRDGIRHGHSMKRYGCGSAD